MDWTVQTLAALKPTGFAMLPQSVGGIVQHALSLVDDADIAKAALVKLLVDECCLDKDMPTGVLVSVLPPVIDTLVFLLSDPSIVVIKRTLQGATALYRIAFQTIAAIPLVDVSTWVKLCQLKAGAKAFLVHANVGVRSNAIKFIQTLALAHSYSGTTGAELDVSLDLCPPNHPYLVPSDLQRESVEAFSTLLSLLNENCPSAIMTASINALFPIIKSRTVYSAPAVQSLIQWIRAPPTHLSALQVKNVQRAIRNEFLAVLSIKLPEVAPFIPIITEILVGMGVKGYEIATRVKARDQGAKRIVDEGPAFEEPLVAAAPPQIATVDVQTIPLNIAVDVVTHVMATTPDPLWLERLALFAQTLLLQEQGQQQTQQQYLQQRKDPRMLKSEPEDTPMDLMSQLGALNYASSSSLHPQIKAETIPLSQNSFAHLLQHQQQPQQPTTVPQPIALLEPEFDPTNVNVSEMSTEDKQTTWKEAISRILELEVYFDAQAAVTAAVDVAFGLSVNPLESVSAARTGWMLLLVRLLTSWKCSFDDPADDTGVEGVQQQQQDGRQDEWKVAIQELREQLFGFIVSEFRSRYELAILWLHEEYHLGLVESMKIKKKCIKQQGESGETVEVDKNPFSNYEALFHRILHALKGETRGEGEEGVSGLDPKDRTFTKFLIDVPLVTKEALEVVLKGYCEDSERMLLGFSSLRDLIHLRPAVREYCIQTLFAYTVDTDKIRRSNAILLARRWISPDHAVLGPIVEKYATETLLKLCGPPPGADEEEEDGGGAAWEEIDAIRHFELYFALSSKKHSLLGLLFNSFEKFKSEVSTTIIQQIDPLIRSMASAVTPICTILQTFPKGAEALVRRVVDILTEKEPVHEEIVAVVVDLVVDHDLDGTWLLRVISGLSKQQVIQFLPKLIALLDGTEERETLVETGLFKVIATDQDGVNPLLLTAIINNSANNQVKEIDRKVNPAEVLIAIHNMEGTVDLKFCLEGTKLCIKHPEVFKQESLAIVIQQLVDQQKIPTLL
ncbi:UNVERIFIED_CONTAM: hypothetical protein HDU68_007085 [Siphonaria sp. JEL0065]|nr:hypothetical protein HDU68_007085 [Siphonaria sp. JEL0065]